jgi:hypothetical protein
MWESWGNQGRQVSVFSLMGDGRVSRSGEGAFLRSACLGALDWSIPSRRF